MVIFNGKIHYKWPFSIAMLVHQRVNVVVNMGTLWWTNILLWKDPPFLSIFHGKIHDISTGPFSIAMLVHQRVKHKDYNDRKSTCKLWFRNWSLGGNHEFHLRIYTISLAVYELITASMTKEFRIHDYLGLSSEKNHSTWHIMQFHPGHPLDSTRFH